ncbi:MAG: FlgD immunoglobulin-like domain containing protein, partial [Pseudomonadota bacterium]
FDGQTAAEVTLTPPEGAERATLTITNDFGLTIGTLDLDPNATSYSWSGLDAAGTLSPAGSYTLTATYFSGDALTAEVIAGSYATVTEVRFADSGTQLILDTGASVDPDDVSGLRLPQTG